MRVVCLFVLLGLAPAAAQTGSPSPEDSSERGGGVARGCSPRHPAYNITRDLDRWDALADPTCRTDYADPVKHVPLGGGSFAYLGGQVRSLGETFVNQTFDPEADDTYLLQRTMLHLGVQIGRRDGGDDGRGVSARLFGQLKSGLAPGLDRQAPPDRDTLDLGQAFAELEYAWDGADGGGASSLALRAGRLELHYGAGRLVSAREGPNVRSSYDGALARLTLARGALAGWSADAFVVQPNSTSPGVFDNAATEGARFWGVVARGPLASLGTAEVYLLTSTSDGAFYDQGPADETRTTLAARLTRNASTWSVDVEGGAQLGTGRTVAPDGALGPEADIAAWYASANATVSAPALPGAPLVGLYSGLNSGDADAAEPDNQTFRAPFPPGRYFGAAAPFGPSNLAGVRPYLTLSLPAGVALTASAYGFWRTRTTDGVYGVPGNPVRTGQTSSARFVGWEPELVLGYTLDAHLAFRAEVSHFAPGRFLDEATEGGDARPVTYAALRATYTF